MPHYRYAGVTESADFRSSAGLAAFDGWVDVETDCVLEDAFKEYQFSAHGSRESNEAGESDNLGSAVTAVTAASSRASARAAAKQRSSGALKPSRGGQKTQGHIARPNNVRGLPLIHILIHSRTSPARSETSDWEVKIFLCLCAE